MGWTGDFDTVFSSSSKTEQKSLQTKKSKETIDLLKQMVADGNISQDVAEKYCPDLKGDDDMIKNTLIKSFDYNNPWEFLDQKGITKESIITWIKKKGEQKPAEWRR